METKHTPGPWTLLEELTVIANRPGGSGRHVLAAVKNLWQSWEPRGEQEAFANAKLIAAAPDLLEALQGLLADITEYQSINNLGGENNHWQVRARAAIDKATR